MKIITKRAEISIQRWLREQQKMLDHRGKYEPKRKTENRKPIKQSEEPKC